MFSRRDSQKPSDDFYATFKSNFPPTRLTTTTSVSTADVPAIAGHTLNDQQVARSPLSLALLADSNLTSSDGQLEDLNPAKDLDATPKGTLEDWKYGHGLLETGPSTFGSFNNAFTGIFTPTPGGSTLYHHQAGDLHAPSMGFGLGTPLSHPTSAGGMNIVEQPSMHLNDHQFFAMSPRHFQNQNPFAFHSGYPPSHFSHQMSSFDASQHSQNETVMHRIDSGLEESKNPASFGYAQPTLDSGMISQLMQPPFEHFRFRVSLSAPTAMIKHSEEIPITYLNKGQAYSVTITDTMSQQAPTRPTKYRTFIRISFEDEQQRARPGSCWQLWKEGRGTNEAHHRGGKLQAVEFVDTNQGDPHERPTAPRIDTASFDGFSVIWHSDQTNVGECNLAVRFNFLSTDFSHSKGVKGIPVRLCAKTEVLDLAEDISPANTTSEISYCKVKLFRDHGAERKLANDIAHVKKTSEKLKQQIAQAEAGIKDVGKRKRSSSAAGLSSSSRPIKVTKHKRAMSSSSESSGIGQISPEEDMHMRLAGLQAMFTSTRPMSILFLRGEELDDPDLHPVSLQGQPPSLVNTSSHESSTMDYRNAPTVETSSISIVSPTPSHLSANSQDRRESGFKVPTPLNPLSRKSSDEWSATPNRRSAALEPQTTTPTKLSLSPEVPVKIRRSSSDQKDSQSWSPNAVNVDPNWEPPVEQPKPVACFYVKPKGAGTEFTHPHYSAIYPTSRTLQGFLASVAKVCDVKPDSVATTFWDNCEKDIRVKFDDDVVNFMPEGQIMQLEFILAEGTGKEHSGQATRGYDLVVRY